MATSTVLGVKSSGYILTGWGDDHSSGPCGQTCAWGCRDDGKAQSFRPDACVPPHPRPINSGENLARAAAGAGSAEAQSWNRITHTSGMSLVAGKGL